jgi:hypothetical protein
MTSPRRAAHTGVPPPLTLEVEHGLVSQFQAEAARRNVPVEHLIRNLLDVIAADHLTGAILDDGEILGDGNARSE